MYKGFASTWSLRKDPLTSSWRMTQAVNSLFKSDLKFPALVEEARKSIAFILYWLAYLFRSTLC